MAVSISSGISGYDDGEEEKYRLLSKMGSHLRHSGHRFPAYFGLAGAAARFLGLPLFPLFLINLYYAKRNNDRALLNDIAAILVFSAGGLASFWMGAGKLDGEALFVFIQSALFFTGSAFYVKSMIREKKNNRFKLYSWGYHVFLPFISLAAGAGWAVLGVVPSSFRAWFLHGKKLSIKTIGISELVNACFFMAVLIVFLLQT